MAQVFEGWKKRTANYLRALKAGSKPKKVIHEIAEDLLKTYAGKPLIDRYDVYQHLMNYWSETMQDDCYLIAAEGWKAEPYRILIVNKQGKKVDKGWTCDLVPPAFVIDRYFADEKKAIEKVQADRELTISQITELEEEHSAEEGYFADFEKINKAMVQKRLKETQDTSARKAKKSASLALAAEPMVAYQNNERQTEEQVLTYYLQLQDDLAETSALVKELEAEMDQIVSKKYTKLTSEDIKNLVIEDKWLRSIEESVKAEMDSVSQRLTQRVKELEERYETTLPQLNAEVKELEEKVNQHLEKMGFVWN